MSDGLSKASIFERFFESARELFCVAGFDGYFKHRSPRWPKVLGYSMDELMAMSFFDLIHTDDRELTRERMASRPTGEEDTFLETRYLCKDGSYRLLQWTAVFEPESELFYGVARDITEERKRVEVRIQKEREHYALITESVADATWDIEDAEEKIFEPSHPIYISPGCYKMLGYEPGELEPVIGTWTGCIYSEDMPRVVEAITGALAHKSTRYQCEYRVVRKDGSLLWVEVMGLFVWDENGKARRFAGVIRNISKRKRDEAELKEKVELIERQRDAIRSLSIPIIQVWKGVVVLPIIGVLDSERAAEMMERLLGTVVETRSSHAILDMTGVEIVDTSTAGYLFQVIASVRLLGAKSVVSGIRPAVAQTMVALGHDLTRMETAANLHQALARAMSEIQKGR